MTTPDRIAGYLARPDVWVTDRRWEMIIEDLHAGRIALVVEPGRGRARIVQ